ncbi:Ser/Thr protein kinase [Reticulomyxa filosa]|uniref:Ser/Thr protein kinase n=1 Tax=Reticulomyxa filosa TaxID=46433 RepID=X6N709_RETFI|nr:Ser/Thr protein kinase [Reticulomyxa filosa]|eukprot:ETO21092.1 Ser/Thr protein kinase [Reticulomyxa filosa]
MSTSEAPDSLDHLPSYVNDDEESAGSLDTEMSAALFMKPKPLPIPTLKDCDLLKQYWLKAFPQLNPQPSNGTAKFPKGNIAKDTPLTFAQKSVSLNVMHIDYIWSTLCIHMMVHFFFFFIETHKDDGVNNEPTTAIQMMSPDDYEMMPEKNHRESVQLGPSANVQTEHLLEETALDIQYNELNGQLEKLFSNSDTLSLAIDQLFPPDVIIRNVDAFDLPARDWTRVYFEILVLASKFFAESSKDDDLAKMSGAPLAQVWHQCISGMAYPNDNAKYHSRYQQLTTLHYYIWLIKTKHSQHFESDQEYYSWLHRQVTIIMASLAWHMYHCRQSLQVKNDNVDVQKLTGLKEEEEEEEEEDEDDDNDDIDANDNNDNDNAKNDTDGDDANSADKVANKKPISQISAILTLDIVWRLTDKHGMKYEEVIPYLNDQCAKLLAWAAHNPSKFYKKKNCFEITKTSKKKNDNDK